MKQNIDRSQPLVTVIIPVHNSKVFLQRCLDSVFAQSYQNFELLAVNDGSEDGSLRVLERNAQQDSRLRIISQENQGQGVARNRAIDEAQGEYILFVDSDDMIEPLTLELTVARAEEDRSDFVHFDWKLASRVRHRPKSYNYFNVRDIWTKQLLLGAECDELLDTVSFFSVLSLYRRSFLNANEIRFGEGYVYEDNPFYVLAANYANTVSLVHSPLYIVQPNSDSTTQTGALTDRHAVGHIQALRDTIPRIVPRSQRTYTHFLKYNVQKFIEYSDRRVPAHAREKYARDFVDVFSEIEITLDPAIPVNRYVKYFIEQDVFSRRRYGLFRHTVSIRNSTLVKAKTLGNQIGDATKRLVGGRPKDAFQSYVPAQPKKVDGAFLFLGFDWRYAGNSRALFEMLQEDSRFDEHPLLFVTDDKRVPEELRISPDDNSLIEYALRKAAIVFLESWVSPKLYKSSTALWIQLWHGTPLKRVLFDSHEPFILDKNKNHKVEKYRNVQRWDFLLSDSRAATEKFASAFLFPKERILQTGYPRVHSLLEARKNSDQQLSIRRDLGLSQDTKVIVYAPTWRDRNYGLAPEEMDYSYVLDPGELADSLGPDYSVVIHEHNYMGSNLRAAHPRCVDASSSDIQDLLSIADGVLSDYSSVIFDCFAAGIPVALYAPDVTEYSSERGIYAEFWKDLEPLISDNIGGVVSLLSDPPTAQKDPEFLAKYAYAPEQDLLDFLDTLELQNLRRDW